jgi:hypothetical protein
VNSLNQKRVRERERERENKKPILRLIKADGLKTRVVFLVQYHISLT